MRVSVISGHGSGGVPLAMFVSAAVSASSTTATMPSIGNDDAWAPVEQHAAAELRLDVRLRPQAERERRHRSEHTT